MVDRHGQTDARTLSGGHTLEGLADSFQDFADGFVHRLPNLLAALVALLLTVVVARLVRRGVERAVGRTDAERHVVVVVATLAFYLAVALGLVVALSIGGVNLGVLIGSLGLATVPNLGVVQVPMLADDVHDLPGLRRLGAHLFA